MPSLGIKLKNLGFDHDLFVNIYHSLVKHEICLIRLGDLCMKTIDKQGYYVSEHGFPVRHNVDAQMTILDVLYAILIETEDELKRSGYVFDKDDVKSFISNLMEKRLLIDMPCVNKKALEFIEGASAGKAVVELSNVDNVYMYYKMFNELDSKYGDQIRELIKDTELKNLCFKTAHGESIKLLRYEAPLPSVRGLEESPYRVLEAYVLPFLEEPLPEYNKDLSKLKESALSKIDNRYNDKMDIIINALRKIKIEQLHGYQYEMLNRMIGLFDKPKIVVISAPTASGKTEIFMTYLVFKLLVNGGVTIIIYPTKALTRQQLERFINFMYHINKQIDNKIHIYVLDGDSPKDHKEVVGKSFRGGVKIIDEERDGSLKYNDKGELMIVWNNGEGQPVEWVHEFKKIDKLEKLAIVITNYSMLSKHIHDGSQWVNDLAAFLNTVVIDEAHVFISNKEKNDFMHFLLLRLLLLALIKRKERNNEPINYDDLYTDIRDLVQKRGLDVILSSATISDRNVLPENIATTKLGGINLAKVARNPQLPPINLMIKDWLMKAYCGEDNYGEGNYGSCSSIIYEPYYDRIGESRRNKLYITAIYFPEPMGASRTPFNEALATTIIWTEVLSKGLGYNLHAIAFVDSKETQREIFRELVRRGLGDECFHADKLLVSPVIHNPSVCPENKGHTYISNLLNQLNQAQGGNDAYQILARYSHLQLYYKWNTVENYVRNPQQNLNLVREATDFAYDVHKAALNYTGNRVCKPSSNKDCTKYYVLLHNADLEKGVRQGIEDVLSNYNDWNLVIATSTLELGVNIPGVAATLQFGAPPSGESFVQRVGRSGRDNRSLRIAFGSVFTRNVGKDIALIDETEAIKNLFNLTAPAYSSEPDNETLIRYMALIYLDKAIKANDDIIRAILRLYLNNTDANQILNSAIKLTMNYNELKKMIKQHQQAGTIPFMSINKNRDIVSPLSSIAYWLDNIMQQLSKSNVQNQYIKNIQNIQDNLKALIDRFINLKELSLSRYLQYNAFIIYKLLCDIESTIVNNNGLKSMALINSYISMISQITENIKSLILKTMVSREGLCLTSRDLDELALLLMGMPMPHPAVLSEIGGCMFDFDNVEIRGGEIRLRCNGKCDRSKGRINVLSNVPLKHYGE